jgi:hypothetical protein
MSLVVSAGIPSMAVSTSIIHGLGRHLPVPRLRGNVAQSCRSAKEHAEVGQNMFSDKLLETAADLEAQAR